MHPSLMSAGGSEVTCIMLIEHLQKKHNVTLITDKKFDLEILNKKFDTNAKPVRTIRPFFVRIIGKIEPNIHLFAKLRTALLASFMRGHNHDYDLCISTKMEANFGVRGIQFLHHQPEGMKTHSYDGMYLWLLSLIGRNKGGIEKNTTISPSTYIKDLYERVYNAKSFIVYPAIHGPTNTIKCQWDDRQDGFLIIGEVKKKKKTNLAIWIIDQLIEQEFKTHLHIIGGGSGKYYKKIRRMTNSRSYVILEGFASKEKYSKLIDSHKYVIHTRINEPSAVTVREAIDGGCIIFAHDSGGNAEILRNDKNILYSSKEEAVEKIKHVMMDEQLQQDIKMKLDLLSFNTRESYLKEVDKIIECQKYTNMQKMK